MKNEKLTKAEKKHLKRCGLTLADMPKQIEHMRAVNPQNPGSVCWDCWVIAKKRGLIK